MLSRFARPVRFGAVAAFPFVLAASVPVADGTTYEFVMKTQSTQTGNKETVSMRGRGTYAGDNARLDILDASVAGGSDAFVGKGTYFLVLDGGKKMLLVDPAQKSYMAWDMANMFAGMSKAVNAIGGLVKMQMSDIKIEAQDMGAGQTIQGYSTKHVRMVQNYTMSAKMFGRTSTSRTETTTDYYFSPALRNVANPFVSNSQAMAMLSQMDMFNNPDYKRQMTAANAKLQQGVPLKTVARTVTTDEKGKQQTTISTTEMVNFSKTNVPSSTFVVPAGFALVEMPSMGAAMAGAGSAGSGNTASSNRPGFNADSVAAEAKQGVKEGLKESVKDGAKEATKAKLRGIFKR